MRLEPRAVRAGREVQRIRDEARAAAQHHQQRAAVPNALEQRVNIGDAERHHRIELRDDRVGVGRPVRRAVLLDAPSEALRHFEEQLAAHRGRGVRGEP